MYSSSIAAVVSVVFTGSFVLILSVISYFLYFGISNESLMSRFGEDEVPAAGSKEMTSVNPQLQLYMSL